MKNFLNINSGISLIKKIPSSINTIIFANNELTMVVPSNSVFKVIFFLCHNVSSQFKILSDLTVVDYIENKKRFEVVYMLLSLKYNIRVRIKTYVDETVKLQSISSIYSCSNWLEREVWDLFGIYFLNHSDLRRILTDYGFESYPLRKDFPLNGFISVRYDESNKIVVSESTELMQDFRSFKFQSPWQNSTLN